MDVDVEEEVEVVEEEEDEEEEEEATPVDCCCEGSDTLLSLCAAESPPATPPPMAAPNTTKRSTSNIQNVRVASPQMRDDDVGGTSWLSGWSSFTFSGRTEGTTSSPWIFLKLALPHEDEIRELKEYRITC